MKPGEKVVCIYTPKNAGKRNESTPKKGELYTLRDVFHHETGNKMACRLMEIVNPSHFYKTGFSEACFPLEYFRPIDRSVGDKVAEYITEQCEQVEVVNQN